MDDATNEATEESGWAPVVRSAIETRMMLAQMMPNSPIKDLEERFRWIRGEEPAVYIITAADMERLVEITNLRETTGRARSATASELLLLIKQLHTVDKDGEKR